jgi:hypothetical protein
MQFLFPHVLHVREEGTDLISIKEVNTDCGHNMLSWPWLQSTFLH